MTGLLGRFADLRRDLGEHPLLYLPGTAAQWSAGDLWSAHQRYAEQLVQAGVGPGQLVVSAAGNSAASVAFFLACRAVNAALMPTDPGTPLPELVGLVQRFGAAAMLCPETVVGEETRVGRAGAKTIEPGLRLVPGTEAQPRSYPGTAVLKLTSGSTGMPKATLTSESQLIADGAQIIAAMGIQPSDVQIAAVPVSHSYGLGNLMLPLLMQGTAFVLRDTFVPQLLPADAQRYGVRVFPGVPFMFEYFLTNPPDAGWPPSLRLLISAGAPLAATTIRAFHTRYGVKIHSFYGASETGGIAYDADDDVDDSATVGRPLPGVTVTLRRDDVGERVHVRSAAVASGYTEAAGDAFTDNGFLTGDYGAWDARGRLTLAGRASAFVNVAGRKVQPDEVERVLRAMPGIADSRVIAADDERRGQQLVACVVVEGGSIMSALAVRRFCAARLAPHKIPRAIIFVDEIPLTARGKTDRTALEGLVRARLSA